MTEIRIGYARCSTDKQDLTAQQEALEKRQVSPDGNYIDKGLTRSNRQRPGLDQALAAVRRVDTLVVPKLDRLARSVPDAREIADALQARGVRLALGASLYDPEDPVGKMSFNVLATFAEFEGDLIRLRTHEGMDIARAKERNSQNCQRSNRKSCAGCMKPGSTLSATWLSYYRFLGQRFTGHFHVIIRIKYAEPGTGDPVSPPKMRVYQNLLSARAAGSSDRRIPDGYILEPPSERNEVILSHPDFQSVEKRLTDTETREQIVGSVLFGGSTWTLRPDNPFATSG